MHLESLLDAEVAVRNAMVQNATNNKLYAELAKMQRRLLKIVKDEERARSLQDK